MENFDYRTLKAYTNHIQAVAGVERYQFTEGKAKGMEVAEVKTGAGLRYRVHLDRGMSLGEASFDGMNVAFLSKCGNTAADVAGNDNSLFYYGFNGGLMFTCGLSQVGAVCVDDGEALSMHGVVSGIRAEEIYAGTELDETGRPVMKVRGKLREGRLFFQDVTMTRTIQSAYGVNSIVIHDEVTNEGFQPAPFMLLYHFNFGWPLLSEDAEFFTSGPTHVFPGNETTKSDMEGYIHFQKPEAGYLERVYNHVFAGEEDAVFAGVRNPKIGMEAKISFLRSQLSQLTEWKMMGSGDYVLGIEPGNCRTFGRAVERAEGRLEWLQPGETRKFDVTLEFNRI